MRRDNKGTGRATGSGSALTMGLALALLAGCASTPSGRAAADVALPDRGTLEAAALQALRGEDAARVRLAAEQWLAQDMRSPRAHLLLGAAHQLQDDPSLVDVAGSGFEAATRLGDAGPWPHYLAGVNLLRQQRPAAAADAFARAVMADPSAGWAHEGLATAAYLTGDLGLAIAAAERARDLGAFRCRGGRHRGRPLRVDQGTRGHCGLAVALIVRPARRPRPHWCRRSRSCSTSPCPASNLGFRARSGSLHNADPASRCSPSRR